MYKATPNAGNQPYFCHETGNQFPCYLILLAFPYVLHSYFLEFCKELSRLSGFPTTSCFMHTIIFLLCFLCII